MKHKRRGEATRPPAVAAQAHVERGMALKQKGDSEGARAAFETAAALAPRFAPAFVKLAEMQRQQGHLDAALASCQKGLDLDPGSIEGHMIRGVIRGQIGQTGGAAEDFRLALCLNPGVAALHIMLSDMLVRLGQFEDAREALTRALALDPGNATAHASLGSIYQRLGQPQKARDANRRAIALDPLDARSHCNLAGVLIGFGEFDASVAASRTAIRLLPNLMKAYVYLAEALRRQGKAEEALATCRQALTVEPGHGEALALLCDLRQQACDWPGLKAEQATLLAQREPRSKRVAVFPILAMSDDPRDHLRYARIWAEGLQPASSRPMAVYAPRAVERRRQRLRIGYLSADFRHHAVAMLIAEVFERHDKSRFELFAYSLGSDDASPMRRRLTAAFDHVIDLQDSPDFGAAERIHADRIDILIDLTGYTTAARSEILKFRPAPIQVNYLGYPGTMGAAFMDYVLVDRFVAPPETQGFYDEKLVHLPDCYQPNDTRRPLPIEGPGRAECGLPEKGFVYCCFNNAYKINSDMFDIWMRLLEATPGAVLWLLQSNRQVTVHLRGQAGARGIDPGRLHFAPLVETDRHLARQLCADLLLDTLPYNAHTTASDALWVGLPVLTQVGEAFAGRVAGSLLAAIGLPELITRSRADYEATALRLAHAPAELAALRDRLKANRFRTALFDTGRYTRSLESALLHMAALRDAGAPPQAFAVPDACTRSAFLSEQATIYS